MIVSADLDSEKPLSVAANWYSCSRVTIAVDLLVGLVDSLSCVASDDSQVSLIQRGETAPGRGQPVDVDFGHLEVVKQLPSEDRLQK